MIAPEYSWIAKAAMFDKECGIAERQSSRGRLSCDTAKSSSRSIRRKAGTISIDMLCREIEVVPLPTEALFRRSSEQPKPCKHKGDIMSTDSLSISRPPTVRQASISIDATQLHPSAPHAPPAASPPSFLVDEIAREEWERVAPLLLVPGSASLAQRSLLAGYCNAVARAVRAEQTLAVEGRYYETTTRRGSLMRRRHPAAQDAQQGWTAARHLAKQLGITGGCVGEQRMPDPRRSVFK
jgi:phage terminase small subunit